MDFEKLDASERRVYNDKPDFSPPERSSKMRIVQRSFAFKEPGSQGGPSNSSESATARGTSTTSNAEIRDASRLSPQSTVASTGSLTAEREREAEGCEGYGGQRWVSNSSGATRWSSRSSMDGWAAGAVPGAVTSRQQ